MRNYKAGYFIIALLAILELTSILLFLTGDIALRSLLLTSGSSILGVAAHVLSIKQRKKEADSTP